MIRCHAILPINSQEEPIFYLAFGLVLSIVGSLVYGIVDVVMFGIVFSLITGLFVSFDKGAVFGVTAGVMIGLCVLRVPLYIIEIFPALHAYHRSRISLDSVEPLRQSPIYFDDLLVLPQPYLSSLLVLIAHSNLSISLSHMKSIATIPFQRWAVQKALRMLIERENLSFFLILNHLLNMPKPYVAVKYDRDERASSADQYFIAKLLLAELADVPPIADFSDEIVRRLTKWLRTPNKSPCAPFAKAYLDLLNNAAKPVDILPVFESARALTHGEEIYQSFRITDVALSCTSLTQIVQCKHEFGQLFVLDAPLRPNIINVFRKLNDAATDASAFTTAENPIARQEARLQAKKALEDARRNTEHVYEPERQILIGIVDHWQIIFVSESARLAESVEAKVLPNPYVAGRALGPKDKLFVGRREVFHQIEGHLQTGTSVVLYGQRRIGKSSILLHLHEHLPHNFLPVYLDLQLKQAETTAGFLFELTRDIAMRLHATHWQAPATPSLNTFLAEPFLTFNAFLYEVESGLSYDQRMVLVFDEFEQLEKQVSAGQIDQRIFDFLRGVTQTRHGFVFVFAGLHTLEQMTHDYWHPFFQSVKPIKVTYFSETEAWQLITGPVDEFPLEYDREAIGRIITVTGGQPYLVQDLCHNLVNYLNDPLHRSNRATMENVNAIIERTLESGTYYFDDYVWGWSNEHERLALAAIAAEGTKAEGGWVTFITIEKHLGRETALTTVKNLCTRDILEERAVGRALEYRFQVELSRLWVVRTQPLARILLEQGKC